MKASDLFVRVLEREGVEFIFGVPGEENLDILNSLRSSSIKLVLTRHEQGAGFMAATYGRLTGKAGVCMATLGPGATNLVTAAAYAQLGGMPMFMLTGQKPIKQSKQGQFQIINVVDMMQPITKFTEQLTGADNIPSRIREAFRIGEEERPGAVHLELPEDIAAEDSDAPLLAKSMVRRPVAEQKSIQRAVEMIERAERPLLVIGAAANRKLTSRMLRQFVANTKIPVVTTQMGKGVVDERDKSFLGNAALSTGDFIHRATDHADVIINVGHDVIEKPPFFMRDGGVQVIHVNFFSAKVDPVYFPQVEVVGDIANSIWRINEAVTPQEKWDFSFFTKVKQHVDSHVKQDAESTDFPILPQRLVADVRAAMPSDGIVSLDNGVYKIWFARNYPAHEPNTVLLDNALATMGAGLPAAMASKLIFPEREVIAVCGDGGFMMNSQELETAVRLNMDLTILILRDDAYGMIKWKQAKMGFDHFGLDYGNPDFVAYADSYGAKGHRVDRTEDLLPLVKECNHVNGVHVIDVPMDYSNNDRILNREIKALSQAI